MALGLGVKRGSETDNASYGIGDKEGDANDESIDGLLFIEGGGDVDSGGEIFGRGADVV